MLDKNEFEVLQSYLIYLFEREFRNYPALVKENGVRKINLVDSIELLKRKMYAIESFLHDQYSDLMFATPGTKVRARKLNQNPVLLIGGTVPGYKYLTEGNVYTISGVYTADWFSVFQLEEFPGLVFEDENLEILDKQLITAENFAEFYGDDLMQDLENAVALRGMKPKQKKY
jgi:hypothetical protein